MKNKFNFYLTPIIKTQTDKTKYIYSHNLIYNNKIYMLSLLLFLCTIPIKTINNKTRVTVVIIVDQLAYSALQKYQYYLNGGLKKLISQGINYRNAFYPHGIPATATGHAGLSTGTYAKDHGIISNAWINEYGDIVKANYDTPENAAVLSPTGVYDIGSSSQLLMVDNLSDQFRLQSLPDSTCYAYALSMKDYAATQMAGKLGKAIWFDAKTGTFTSSKAYFKKIPDWIEQFNTLHDMKSVDHLVWHQAKPGKSRAYDAAFNQQNTYAENPEIDTNTKYSAPHQGHYQNQYQNGMVGKKIPLEWETNPKKTFSLFKKIPQSNKLLLDLAETCINTHIRKKNKNQLILWISISSLDFVGHQYGPDSKETIDTIYHLDKQLARFMRNAQRAAGKNKTLFVLTADHGITPIPEIITKTGFPAHRYESKELIDSLNKDLNSYIQQKKHLKQVYDKHEYNKTEYDKQKSDKKSSDIINTYKNSHIYLHNDLFDQFNKKQKKEILSLIQSKARAHPGIKHIWTYDELKNTVCETDSLESYYKNQLYPNRSGQLIIQPNPYCDITEYKKGADHNSAYNYNTQVPLILYQPSSIEAKTIYKRVSTLQLANTLANILDIPKPSASTFDILPEIKTTKIMPLF